MPGMPLSRPRPGVRVGAGVARIISRSKRKANRKEGEQEIRKHVFWLRPVSLNSSLKRREGILGWRMA